MTETTHPAVEARRRRLHHLRVRIVAAAVGLFIAVFSVIYAQMPASANTTTTTKRTSSPSVATADSSDSSAQQSSEPTPMTTSQS